MRIQKEQREAAAILILAGFLALALTIADGRNSRIDTEKGLLRNTYGKGSSTEELAIAVKGSKEKEPVTIEMGERMYQSGEAASVLETAVGQLDQLVLGKNASFDRVESDLYLPTRLEDLAVSVNWELSRYDVMQPDGSLVTEALQPEGTLVTIKGILRCQEQEALYERTAAVYPETKTGLAGIAQEAERVLQQAEDSSREESRMKLPEMVAGKEVEWYYNERSRGPFVLALGMLLALCPMLWKRQKEAEFRQKREQQMLLDYPEIVSQFTLLTGAGMTVKNAWRQIVRTYHRKKQQTGIHYAYEEMAAAWNEMKSGIPEAECYERFGSRCGLQLYLKFGSLLSQNLKKGTKGLRDVLYTESAVAFENRKREARKKGEEAGTKLLVPMFMMLGDVLLIVVVPAFLSMRV